MADCPSCGSILKYDIPSGKVICESCQNGYRPEEIDSIQQAMEQGMMGVTEFLCPNCGGEIFSTDKDITGVCSYCGSKVVFESRLTQKRQPELIIPFQKTKQDCKDIFKAHLKKNWFVPKELKDDQYIDGFRGIYMPYWLSGLTQEGDIRYYAKDTKSRYGFQITNTYRIKGHLKATYQDLYHDAGIGFSDDISEKLEPYVLVPTEEGAKSNLKPFYASYLSGFYAEPVDVEFKEYTEYFDDLADRKTGEYLEKHDVLREAKTSGISNEDYGMLDLIDYRSVIDSLIDIDKMVRMGAKADSGNEQKVTKKALKKYKEEQYFLEKETEVLYKKLQSQKSAEQIQQEKEEKSYGKRYGFETKQQEKLAMFPVWFMSWRKGKRVAYMSVNGQTGKVCADLPIDMKRFFLVFGAVFLALFAFFSFFTISSYAMPVYAVWFSAIILHMAACELNTIGERAQQFVVHKKRVSKMTTAGLGITGLVILTVIVCIGRIIQRVDTDMEVLWGNEAYCGYVTAGLIYVIVCTVFAFKNWKKLEGDDKVMPFFLFATVAAVISAALVYTNTPNDMLLYGGAAAAFAAMALCMLSMIFLFNKVATRPLPQFEHSGGDDRA